MTLAASSLSSQSVGLSAEPLTAGDSLAPTPQAAGRPPRRRRSAEGDAPQEAPPGPHRYSDTGPHRYADTGRTAVATAVPAVESGDDDGGGATGRGRRGDGGGGGGPAGPEPRRSARLTPALRPTCAVGVLRRSHGDALRRSRARSVRRSTETPCAGPRGPAPSDGDALRHPLRRFCRGMGGPWECLADAGSVTFTTPRVATIAALAALGGIGASALAFQPDPQAAKPVAAATAAPVEVRTETIHRTVRVTRHERSHTRKRRPPVAAAAPPRRVAAVAPARVAAPAPAPAAPSRPLRSRTSGSSGRGHEGDEREHEQRARGRG